MPGWFAKQMNIVGWNSLSSGQCRVSCARQNAVCPSATGWQLVGTLAFPLSRNPYVCDDAAHCVEDTLNICNSQYTKLMPMKTVSVEPLFGLELCT